MAYTLVKAFLKLKNQGTPIEEVALGNLTMRTIFKTYSNGFFVLSNPAITGQVQLELDVLQAAPFAFPDLTFPSWLASIGNQALPTTPYTTPFDPTVIADAYVGFIDAIKYGLSIQAVHASYDLSIDVPDYDKTALYIEDSTPNLYLRANRYLVSINGYLHAKEAVGNGVRVIGGRQTWTRSGQFSAGILNFAKLGTLTERRFTNPNDLNAIGIAPLRQGVVVELHESLVNKTLLVSLGGILYREGKVVKVVDRQRGLVKLDLARLDLRTWYLCAHKQLDLSSLDAKSTGPFDETLQASRLEQDAVVKAYLALPNSFAVIVDKPSLEVRYEYPQDLNVYGRFSDSRDLIYPMIDAYGRIVHYLKFKEGTITSYAVGELHYEYPSLQHGYIDDMELVDELPMPADQLKSQARFMIMY